MKPSWERIIDECFEEIKVELVEYLDSADFEFEWDTWHIECGRLNFKTEISGALCIGGYEKYSKFPIKTATLYLVLKVIESVICAQLP